MTDPTIRASWFARYFDEAGRQGIDTRALIADARLDPDLLSNPDMFLSHEDAVRLLGIISRHTPPDFALRVGSGFSVSRVSPFAYALQLCRTFGEYIDKWRGHLVSSGFLMDIRSLIDGDEWRIELLPVERTSDEALTMYTLEICSSFFPSFTQLTGQQFRPLRIEINAPESASFDAARALLDVPVVSSGRSCLILPRAYRSLPLSFARDAMVDYFRRALGDIGTSLPSEPLITQLRQVLLLSAGHAPTLGGAAQALHLSKRSLNRALARVGWSFSDVVACYRRDIAIALLKTNETTIKEIAAVVGYSDPDSLRRAFRGWTGMSMVHWARKHTGAAPPRSSLLFLDQSA